MEIQNDTFYVLEIDDNKEAFPQEEQAVKTLQDEVGNGTEPDGVSIWEVEINGEQWSIQEIPWSNIAIQLMKGE
jgi:hypothetical protein